MVKKKLTQINLSDPLESQQSNNKTEKQKQIFFQQEKTMNSFSKEIILYQYFHRQKKTNKQLNYNTKW